MVGREGGNEWWGGKEEMNDEKGKRKWVVGREGGNEWWEGRE